MSGTQPVKSLNTFTNVDCVKPAAGQSTSTPRFAVLHSSTVLNALYNLLDSLDASLFSSSSLK